MAPILFAALGAVVASKSGRDSTSPGRHHDDSALFGVLFSYWTQSWLVGVLGAMTGILLALMMASSR
ncbi:MAG: hypothetical protein R2881_04065 [Eubacteriales bacterium]